MLNMNSMLEHITGSMGSSFVRAAVRRYSLYVS